MPPVYEYGNSMSSEFNSSWETKANPSNMGKAPQGPKSYGGGDIFGQAAKKPAASSFDFGSSKKTSGGNDGNPWGDVYKNRQNFNDLHFG